MFHIYILKRADLRPRLRARSFLGCIVPGRRHSRLISPRTAGKLEPSKSTATGANGSTVFRCQALTDERPGLRRSFTATLCQHFSPGRDLDAAGVPPTWRRPHGQEPGRGGGAKCFWRWSRVIDLCF